MRLTPSDALFAWIEKLQGNAPWDSVLDAGTGSHSLGWITGLPTERWTAVTGDSSAEQKLLEEFRPRMRRQDRIVSGNWTDPLFLHGEVHGVVLADYLLGAADYFAPYFQDRVFTRLRPHVGSRLYVVGLEPYPEPGNDPWGKAIREIAALRDACILLAGQRPYREYPLSWVLRSLEASGYAVEDARSFPIRHGASFIEGQLRVCGSKLPTIRNRALAADLERAIKAMREHALAAHGVHGGPYGEDYVVHARPV